MEVKDLSELKKLLVLCRKQGVLECTLGSISFKLGDLPLSDKQDDSVPGEAPSIDELSGDDLIFYSANVMDEPKGDQ